MVGARAEVTKEMVSDPRRIGRIVINITMPSKSYSSVEKKILEAAAHHCPVGLSLAEGTEEVVNIVWPEMV